MYKNKYLKYKNKYFNLKSKIYGGNIDECKIDELDILSKVYLVHGFEHKQTFIEEKYISTGGVSKRIDETKLFSNIFVIDKKKKTIGYKPSEKYIHLAWGKLVMPHYNGSWESNDHAIVVHLQDQKNKIFKINPNDTMILNNLTISNENSFFVYNQTKFNLIADHKQSLTDLQELGFKLYPYTREMITNFEIDDLMSQIDRDVLISGKHTIISPNSKSYNIDLNLDYVYEIQLPNGTKFNKKYNDKEALLDFLSNKLTLFSDKLWYNEDSMFMQEYTDEDNILSLETLVDKHYKYNLKQINTIYIDAIDMITIGKTLRAAIDEIIPPNTFINEHCFNSVESKKSEKEYFHPTLCYNYNNRIFKLGDSNHITDLQYDNLEKRLLIGRHYGLFHYTVVENVIDLIQQLTTFDVKEFFYIQQTYPKYKDKIHIWKQQFSDVLGRNENQFKFSSEIIQNIKQKFDCLIEKISNYVPEPES
jgi:hypothetical protein